MIKKGLAVAVILLFIGVVFAPSINAEIKSNESTCTNFLDDGTLSGYVYDNNMEPIEGALVRVYFHETYEEGYTDSSGYYHVTNIPMCYCMKNCTASKEDYITEWVYLSIGENTTYNFILESDDSDLVEFDVEFCGLNKKHTVKLTQEQANEVEQLFDEIHQKLENVETREEAEVIFNEAVVELDKYDLLGGLSVSQAQRLVTSSYLIPRNNYLNRISDNENYCCLIAGLTENTLFTGHLFRYLSIILKYIIYQSNFGFEGLLYMICLYPFFVFDAIRPFDIGSDILFSQSVPGYVFTLGLAGLKFWKGENLVGLIDPWYSPYTEMYCVLAAQGFIGIRITNYLDPYFTSFYIGWALKVKIDNLDE